VATTATATSGTALADNAYLGVHGMWTDLDDLDFQVAPGRIDSTFDSGTGFGVTVGRSMGQMRGEIEYTRRMNDIDSHSLNGGAALAGSAGEVTSDAFMLNGYYHFTPGGSFSPYVGAGIGFSKVSFDAFGVTAIPDVLDDSATEIAYQMMVGAEFVAAESWTLFAEYRYFSTGDVDVTTSSATGSVDTSASYSTNNVVVGARIQF
jgi:opacity protein-like surface antigen